MEYDLNLYTPSEIEKKIAINAKDLRLANKLKQSTLAERAGISVISIKRFESTGKIQFSNLLKIANVLDCLEDFLLLFPKKEIETSEDLIKLENNKNRKRGSL